MRRFTKKIIGAFLGLSMFASVITPLGQAVNASEYSAANETLAREIKIASNFKVSLYNDGRIEAIENPEMLTNEQREEALKIMKFTDEEIQSFPEELQNDLLADGGVKVDLNTEMVRVYTDLSGVDHVVTPENEEEIEKIRMADYRTVYGENNKIVPYGSHREGSFTGSAILTYLGSDSVVFKYKYRTTFDWSSKPVLTFTDSIAHAWQSHTTSVGSTAKQYRLKQGIYNFTYPENVKIYNDVTGTRATVDITRHDGNHYGYIEDEVRIPLRHRGEPGQFVSAYGHAWSASLIDVVLNYFNIYLNGFGDKWTWRNNFTIGQQNLS
ncbi:hypothetical protein ACXZ7E_09350 [Paenibacillus lautus]